MKATHSSPTTWRRGRSGDQDQHGQVSEEIVSQCCHPLTVNPHLQVTSDPADQVGRRSLLAALCCHRLVSAHLQQQHLIQHHLPQLRGELCDQLQAGGEKLTSVNEVLKIPGRHDGGDSD